MKICIKYICIYNIWMQLEVLNGVGTQLRYIYLFTPVLRDLRLVGEVMSNMSPKGLVAISQAKVKEEHHPGRLEGLGLDEGRRGEQAQPQSVWISQSVKAARTKCQTRLVIKKHKFSSRGWKVQYQGASMVMFL